MVLKFDPDGKPYVEPRDDLLRRAEISENPMSLEELHFRLAVATELAESLPDAGRQGIFRAVIDVTNYLSGLGIPRATLHPLDLVAHALVDADRGSETAAFAPAKIPGRPPIKTIEYEPRALTAVVVECCIRQKKLDGAKAFRAEGAALAKTLLKQAAWAPDLNVAELLRLREEVTSRQIDDPMRHWFESMIDSPLLQDRPQEYAKQLTEHGWVNRMPTGPTKLS